MPHPGVQMSYDDELEYWKQQLRHGIHSKTTKEYILKKMRALGAKLGVLIPDYNSEGFSVFLGRQSEL